MTVLDTREAPETAPGSGGADITHEVCCLDEGKTVDTLGAGALGMCGLDLTGAQYDAGETTCVVCAELIERWAHYAQVHDERHPLHAGGVPCRVCPRLRREQPDA